MENQNKKLVITGKNYFMGVEVPNIEGGFGEGKKCVLAKTVAEIHGVELKDINRLIKNNLEEFEFGVDILDLKEDKNFEVGSIHHEIFTQNALNRISNIYLLSESGYMALVGLMKTDKAKEIRKQFRREYFLMRKQIENNELETTTRLLNRIDNMEQTVVSLMEVMTNLTKTITNILVGDKKEIDKPEKKPLEPETIPHGFFKFDWENDFNYEGLIIPIEFILNVRNWYVIDNEVNKDRVSRDRIYKTRNGEFYVSKMFIVSFVQKYKRDNNKQKLTTNSQGKKVKNNNKFGKKKEIVQYLKNPEGGVKEVWGIYEGVTDAHVKTGYGLTSISCCVSGATMYAFKNNKGERIYWDYMENFEAKYPDYKL